GIDITADQLVQIAAEAPMPIVALHYSQNESQRTYLAAKTRGLDILPLVMDFVEPTPARGLGSHRCVAATERLKCECLVAPGLIDDLLLRYRRIPLEVIVDGLGAFATRQVVLNLVTTGVESVKAAL